MTEKFVHLHVHSEFSLIDGILRIDQLVAKTRELGMRAVALTDHTNLFAVIKFYKKALQMGVKPIIGADCWVKTTSGKVFLITLLCKNNKGHKELSELISKAYLHSQAHNQVVLAQEWIAPLSNNLIALSGGVAGDIGQALLQNDYDKAQQALQVWHNIFGENNFYLEITRTNGKDEKAYEQHIIEFARRAQAPLVATNNVRFAAPKDFQAHDARVCINQGVLLDEENRPQDYTKQQYLSSPEYMEELFADVPSALVNSVEIAKRCSVMLDLSSIHLPNYPTPQNKDVTQYLSELSRHNLAQILEKDGITEQTIYQQRLEQELHVINSMQFSGYFLIVADFIKWAKDNNIPVGPGRGSGAGSLVAYVLGITGIDPLKYDLLFERFLNPERVSMPDFDIDFCIHGRDRVIEYVMQKYGKDCVAQIITFGTMAAKAVIRDVGRVLGLSYGFVDQIAKLIPFELGMTLQKALEDSPVLKERYTNEAEVTELVDLALSLEGIARHAGKHAGGVVIAPCKLTDFTPLYCVEDSVITQLDKDDIETIGLVKFDFLGLRNLTVINKTLDYIKLLGEDIAQVVQKMGLLDDALTFKLVQACNTEAIFQLESSGMKELIKRLVPDCFEDIVALVALFRPGPLQSGMVDDFVNRKHKRAKVEYPHPLLKDILEPTYGVILYQEQVMHIAQVLAGYSLGEADLLRRAMGKKKPEEMEKQRSSFINGAVKNNIAADTAENIFNIIEKFAGYGFNKSHSVAYALISYQTAWLKAHYPAQFMAAVLSSDMDNLDKMSILIDNCRRMQIKVLLPDINQSDYEFKVLAKDTLIYGLGAIKGVGAAIINEMVKERKQHGAYKNLLDLVQRGAGRKINKKVLESLIKSGAVDSFQIERSTLYANIQAILSKVEQDKQNKLCGQQDLFGAVNDPLDFNYVAATNWTQLEQLKYEREHLGVFITGHPLHSYRQDLAHLGVKPIYKLKNSNSVVKVAGIVASIKNKKTKSGKRMQIVSLEDERSAVEFLLFDEDIEKYQEVVQKDALVVAYAKAQVDNFSGKLKLNLRDLVVLDEVRFLQYRVLELTLTEAKLQETPDIQRQLLALLQQSPRGACQVIINYLGHNVKTKIKISRDLAVALSSELLAKLDEMLGANAATLIGKQQSL